MAQSPTTIPTSFVPKQPVRPGTQFSHSGTNVFLTIAIVILGVSILSAGATFGYEQYLLSVREKKSAEVKNAQAQIDSSTVEEFIRTRDRFTAAKGLLDSHVAVSNFFDTLETLTLQTVRFNSLSFNLAEDRSAEIRMDGVARTFNALAAQSSAFANEKRIKRAIFSGITVNENKTVSFSLAADLDAKLLVLVPEEAPVPPPSFEEETTASTTAEMEQATEITP